MCHLSIYVTQQNIFNAFDRHLVNTMKTVTQSTDTYLVDKRVHTYNKFADITNSLVTHKVVCYKCVILHFFKG